MVGERPPITVVREPSAEDLDSWMVPLMGFLCYMITKSVCTEGVPSAERVQFVNELQDLAEVLEKLLLLIGARFSALPNFVRVLQVFVREIGPQMIDKNHSAVTLWLVRQCLMVAPGYQAQENFPLSVLRSLPYKEVLATDICRVMAALRKILLHAGTSLCAEIADQIYCLMQDAADSIRSSV